MLTVISFTVIGAMTIVARVNVSVKNNEVLDLVNDTVIKSLELAKSPSSVYISNTGLSLLNSNNNYYYFALKDGVSGKLLQYNPTGATDSFTDCNSSSFYYVPIIINGTQKNYTVCMRYKIRRLVASDSSNYYEIEINTVYYLENRKLQETFKTYRYGTFTGI